MNKYLLLLLLLIIGCSQFPTRYDLIETDKIRLLDFIYEPADAAPGDTVKLTAVFAGKNVTVDMIDWKVSYRVASNTYGFDTAFDIQPLSCNPVVTEFSKMTSSFSFDFKIPDSIMYTSPMIKNAWVEILPAEYQDAISDKYRKLSKAEILDTIQKIAALVESANPEELQLLRMMIGESTIQQLAGLLQMFTVKMRVIADVKDMYRVRSDYSVRYNRIFNKLSGEYFKINTNPVIDSVVVYKVPQKGLLRYIPTEGRHTAFRLYGEERDSITRVPIDTHCTYFTHVFTSGKDTSISLGGMVSLEDHVPQYYYTHDPDETGGISGNNFMNIQRIDNDSIHLLFPPVNKKIQSFTLWVEIDDHFPNEFFRPLASMLKEFRGRFEY